MIVTNSLTPEEHAAVYGKIAAEYIVKEINTHIESIIEDLDVQGWDTPEARRALCTTIVEHVDAKLATIRTQRKVV